MSGVNDLWLHISCHDRGCEGMDTKGKVIISNDGGASRTLVRVYISSNNPDVEKSIQMSSLTFMLAKTFLKQKNPRVKDIWLPKESRCVDQF
jgi:hypothetical protein